MSRLKKSLNQNQNNSPVIKSKLHLSFSRGIRGKFPSLDSKTVEKIAVRSLECAVLNVLGPKKRCKGLEFSLFFCDDAKILELNKGFRGKEYPTNVLSFPNIEPDILRKELTKMDDDPSYIGDIAISLPTVLKESEEQGKPFANHLSHMVVHGVLHLMGFDHMDEEQAHEMESLEIGILSEFGIANPYVTTTR